MGWPFVFCPNFGPVMIQYLSLLDADCQVIGKEEKLIVHQKGLLHAAFSIVLYDCYGNMLLQKRALSKYHSAGLWTNACCSHPSYGESMDTAIQRRLEEELGLRTEVVKIDEFIYYYQDPVSGLIEHEYDQIYEGVVSPPINYNPYEIAELKWMSWESILADVEKNPEIYTFWFKYWISRNSKNP